MTPIELRSRREALGLSQSQLAEVLAVGQNTLSQWEAGKRRIPAGIADELDRLERVVDDLVERMVEAAERVEDPALMVHLDDESWWAAHPGNDGQPAALQRVAAARAAAELRWEAGLDVPIVPAELSKTREGESHD